MAERATIARPYARAAFEFARDSARLAPWSCGLEVAAQIVADPRVAALTKNPRCTPAEMVELIGAVAGARLDASMHNFLSVLAENRRLLLLGEIGAQFERLRAEVENIVDVEAVSAVPLDEGQIGKLAGALSSRLARTVRLHCQVVPALLGGAVLRVGDLVIDGSVQGNLLRLATELEK